MQNPFDDDVEIDDDVEMQDDGVGMQDDDVGHDVDFSDGSNVSTPKPLKKTIHNQADTEDEDSPIEIFDDKFETPRALKAEVLEVKVSSRNLY